MGYLADRKINTTVSLPLLSVLGTVVQGLNTMCCNDWKHRHSRAVRPKAEAVTVDVHKTFPR